MKEVINLLYDIEEKANAIIDQTSLEKKALHEQLLKDIESSDSEINAATRDKIKSLQEKMSGEIKEEHKQMISNYETLLTNLSANFEKNQENFVEDLFQKIIGE